MGEFADTIEVVFPYPYRFWRAIVSRSYRNRLKTLYREQPKTWVATDVLVSGFFFLAETGLIIGIPITLVFG